MIICKKRCVNKSPEGKVFVGFIMAVQTKAQVLSVFLRMPDGDGWTLFSGACQKNAHQDKC